MKKVIIVFIAIFCITNSMFSQDIIVVQGNKEIQAEVVSVTSYGIEYLLGGRLYKLRLQDVVSLTYKDGRVEDLSIFLPKQVEKTEELTFFREDNMFYLGNKRLSDEEIRNTLSSNPSALDLWERGNRSKNINQGMKIATGVLLISGGVITIVSFSAAVALAPLILLGVDNNAGTWFYAGLVLFSAGIVTAIMIPATKSNYKSYYSDAVGTYNNGLKTRNTVSLHIGAVGNGLGFSLKF